MRINLSSNVEEVSKNLYKFERDQLPFAISLAVNDTAEAVANEITRQMPQYLDRPTPFTETTFQYRSGKFRGKRANKRTLTAIIEGGEIQSKYLKFQVEGGTETPKKRAIAVPTKNAPLNRYGNIPNRKAGLIKKPTQFSAEINGIAGIWERSQSKGVKKLKLIMAYEPSVQYQPRFPIYKIADGISRNTFNRRFDVAMKKALATARTK